MIKKSYYTEQITKYNLPVDEFDVDDDDVVDAGVVFVPNFWN